MKKRDLARQVIVITGGSSGIGLATARLAADAGARVVLVAREEERLARAVERLDDGTGRVTYVVADVGEEEALKRVAEQAVTLHGRIDTWVSNAGAMVYGGVEEVSTEDMRKVFDVVFWGVVHGARAALPHLRRARGTLIHVGSIESEVPVPLSAAYTAAKHAVKGYTDVLRIELDEARAGVAVSLVSPSAIGTPLFDHAKSYLRGSPRAPRPSYAPEVVARAILRCAERPVREVVVGGTGRVLVAARHTAPRAVDLALRKTMYRMQEGPRRPGRDPEGELHRPKPHPPRERGEDTGPLLGSSPSARFAMKAGPAAGLVVAGTVLGATLGRARARRRRDERSDAPDAPAT